MWFFFKGKSNFQIINEQVSAFNELEKELQQEKIKSIRFEAELGYERERSLRFLAEIDRLNKEKASLLEDLLIAAGVKMSAAQEKILAANLAQSEKEPAYTSQASHWAMNRTMDSIKEFAEDRRSIVEATRQLEQENGLI